MARAPAKALRIGIIQKGRIVEERLVRTREPVTIGSGPRNTFTVPLSDLPESFTLFHARRRQLSLAFDDRMDGRVHGPSGAADFGALVTGGAARRSGEVHLLPLREEQWGKVRIGEVTVLFQFVTPPPAPPRPVLPRAARGNHFRSMDPLFVLALLGSLAVHVSAYAGLQSTPVREEVTIEEIPDRFAKLLIPERHAAPAPRVEEARREEPGDRKAEEKKPEEKAAPEGEGKERDGGGDEKAAAAAKAARGAAVARAVQQKGLLRVLGALGAGGRGGSAVAAVFGGAAGGLGDVAAALAGSGAVAVAGVGEAGVPAGRRGGGGGAPASIGDLGTSGGGGGKVALGAKTEVKVTGAVAAEDAEIDSPDLDQAKLGGFVRARMGAIKACYENQLKRNPGLRGRVRIRFTILETGALADVAAVENALGSSEVVACIVATMSAWRTPFRPSGTVTVEYPFVFSAAN